MKMKIIKKKVREKEFVVIVKRNKKKNYKEELHLLQLLMLNYSDNK